jgi:hypothetical protein
MFHLRKGDNAVSIYIESLPDGRISTLRTADREYDW